MPEQQKEYIPTYEEIEEAESMMSKEQIDLSAARAEQLDRLIRKSSGEPILELTKNLIDQSENFEFYSTEGTELPEGFKEYAEDILKRIKEYLGVKDLEKIKVTFLQSEKQGSGACIIHLINSVDTRIVFSKGSKNNNGAFGESDKIIFTHDLTHRLLDYWTGNKTHPPVTFLDEGFADYVTIKLLKKDESGEVIDINERANKWLKEKPGQKKYLSLSELPTNFEYGKFEEQGKKDDVLSQYCLGRSFINYLIENFGLEKLRNIMKKAIDGANYWSMEKSDRQWMQDNMNRVFQEELGVSAEELMKKWADKLEKLKEQLKTD